MDKQAEQKQYAPNHSIQGHQKLRYKDHSWQIWTQQLPYLHRIWPKLETSVIDITSCVCGTQIPLVTQLTCKVDSLSTSWGHLSRVIWLVRFPSRRVNSLDCVAMAFWSLTCLFWSCLWRDSVTWFKLLSCKIQGINLLFRSSMCSVIHNRMSRQILGWLNFRRLQFFHGFCGGSDSIIPVPKS